MSESASDVLPRRCFLASSLATIGLACSPPARLLANAQEQLFKISIAPWSLMRRIAGQKDPNGIDLWDYPKVARELGFTAVEHDNLHFPGELPHEKTIQRMRKTCDEQGVTSTLILCGALGDIADADKTKREKAIDKYRAWAGAAKTLGCAAIRVVCADRKNDISFDEKRKLAVDGISLLAEHNAKLGIELLIENHGGYSSDPRWLTQVVKEVNQPNCGILADFTLWSVQREPEVNVIDPYEGMKLLARHTRSVSAHAYEFGSDGRETKWDYHRMMKMLTDAGFRGYVAVEYFGRSLTRREGSRQARSLLQQVRDHLS